MEYLYKLSMCLARASKGNPATSTATVMLFALMFNILEAAIEKLLFGERFEHFLDPIILLAFIGFAAFSVYSCAVHNSQRQPNQE